MISSQKDKLLFRNVSWIMKRVDVPVLLKRIGIDYYQKRGNEIVSFCPDHHLFVGRKPSHPKWYFNIKNGKTNCYTEGRGSNIVYIVSRLRGCSPRDAVKWILQIDSDSDISIVRFDELKNRLRDFQNNDEEESLRATLVLNDIEDEINNGVVYDRGYEFFMNPPDKKPTNIVKDTVDHFRVVERRWGYYKDRVMVPFFQKKKLVAFCAIDVLGEGKWKENNFLKRGKKYKKVLNPKGVRMGECLFGYDEVNTRAESLFISEGPRDAMKLWQEGFTNSVSAMGTSLSDVQTRLLSELCPQKIYIMLDGNDAGRVGAKKKMAPKLCRFFDVNIVDLPEGYDPKNFDRKELLGFIKKSYKFGKNT